MFLFSYKMFYGFPNVATIRVFPNCFYLSSQTASQTMTCQFQYPFRRKDGPGSWGLWVQWCHPSSKVPYHIYGATASLPWIASTWVVSHPQVMCSLLPRHSHDLARHCPNLCVLYIPSLATVVFLFSGQSAWAHWTKRWVQGQWDWAFVAL